MALSEMGIDEVIVFCVNDAAVMEVPVLDMHAHARVHAHGVGVLLPHKHKQHREMTGVG